MIRVRVTSVDGHYRSVHVTGHAGSNVHGEDIVCAAASVLVETLAATAEELFSVGVSHLQEGRFELMLPERTLGPEVDVMMQMFVIGMKGIQLGYPKYLRLEIQEVQR